MTETEPSPPIEAANTSAAVPEAASDEKATAEKAPAKPREIEMPREIEIKFIADAAGLASALASPLLSGEAAPSRKLTSVYFDTPDWVLHRNRIALRVRRSGRAAPMMTLKWPAEAMEGVFARGEIEFPVPKLQPDLTLFEGELAEKLRELIGDSPLAAKYETRVTRVTRLVSHGAARIEAAFDEGVIAVGERSRPLCELELELKSGEPRELYEFAALVADSLPLVLDIVSKAERAFHFAKGSAPAPLKMRPAPLAPEVILDEGVARVALGCCDHYIANWAALRDGDDPEAIHQMRVALRRLRAALAMFKRAIPCGEFELFRAEARDLATAMGPARDCDALRELVEIGPLAHFGERKDFSPLLDALEQRRLGDYQQARAMLASRRPTLFVLKLSAFVARRGWRNALSVEELSILTGTIDVFAAEALERLYSRVLKRGKNLAELPDAQRHRARIALKNLRYGAEFFASCFAQNRDVAAFIRATAQLQNVLGAHNDAASADHFLSQLHDSGAARAAGLVTGWYARGALIADEELAQDWKNFKRIKPFWR
ncbi:MAG: CHAD domain-containing protein [Rhodoblastus sp.]|uniref:CYTH and CHAD domain-containing protein n=1 Tax=Rhodoblastus sp. TaxID=1962975 RepID=UPI003F958D06